MPGFDRDDDDDEAPPHPAELVTPGESYGDRVSYDGTRADYIRAALEYLERCPDGVTSVDFSFEGQMIVLPRSLVLGRRIN